MLISLASAFLFSMSAATPPEHYLSNTKDLQGESVELVRIDEPTRDMDDAQVTTCRSVKEVGSRIPLRVCRTKAEWVEIDRVNQDALQERRRNAGQIGADGDIIRSM